MMEDKRQLKRRHLVFYLRVFDAATDNLLGYVVDITNEGLMLVSETPIDKDKVFTIKMDLPAEIEKKTHLKFEAKSLWCKNDINSDYFDVGFQIKGIAHNDIQVIEDLINYFGFND